MKAKILLRQRGILKLEHPDGHTSWGFVKEIGGKKYRTSGWRTRRQAEEAMDTLKQQRFRVSIGAPPLPQAITFRRLKLAYLKDAEQRGVSAGCVAGTRAVLDRFEKLLDRDALVTSVTAGHFREYLSARRADGLHPHSIAYEMKRIKSALRAARRLADNFNWLPPDLPRVTRVHKGRRITLSEQQIENLLNASPPELHDLITVALHSGLRVGELLNISRATVDFSAGIDSRFGRLRLISEKSGTADVIPLTEEAAGILRARLEKSEHAFELTYDWVRRAFRSACKRAGISYGLAGANSVVFHTIRHTTASYLLNQGAPLHTVQAICRHSAQTMTLSYTHASAADVGAAIERLGQITKPA